MWPRFLPDGRHFLYLVRGSRKEDQWLEIGTLGSGETRRLIEAESGAFYAPPGYLLFVRGGSLLAQPFDAAKLSFTADPIPVAEEIGMNAGSSYHAFAVSEAGMLVYRVGGLAARSLTWFDRAGRQVAVLGKPGEITNPEISPDGKKVVFEREPSQGSTAELWAMDLARETQARLTFGSTDEFEPIWSPDGSRIFFASFRDESVSIFVKDASGAAGEEALLTTHTMKDLMDVSRDGRFLAFCEESPETQLDLMVMPLTGDRTPRPFAKTRFVECQARFSPDSKWLAYASDETGRSEVHVQSFPGPGGKWQISTNGGGQPQWSRDGKEIFYMGFNGSIMVTPIETRGDAIEPGTPVRITDTGLGFSTVRNHYSVSPDGQRILVSLRAGNTVSPPMTVVLNWTADLKR
jgi:Tol biopolymer transport system component